MTPELKTNVMMPIVSVILPVFNAEKYVEEAVRSILDQTFRNFELIIIDDGSTDGTLRILKNLKALDERVVLITRENKGLIETLNEGIRISRGIWTARMDADDICLPTRIESQLKYCIEHNIDICGSHIEMFGIGRKKIRKYPLLDSDIRFGLAMNTQFAHPVIFGKTACFRALKYSDSYKHCEDYDLWVRAACLGYKFGNVDMVLLKYRLHSGQVSVMQAEKQFIATLEISNKYRAHIYSFRIESDECNPDVLTSMKLESSTYHYFIIRQLIYISEFYGCSNEQIKDYLIFLSKRDRSFGFTEINGCLELIQMRGAKRLAMFLRCAMYKLAPLRISNFVKNIYYSM